MEITHKKNTAKYLAVPMVNASTPASFITGETVADTAYYKDGAGAWTSLAITDTFSEIGATGVYEIDLTAAEMNHDQVLIKLTSSGSADSMVLFQMYGVDVDDLALTTDLATVDGKIDVVDDYIDTEITALASAVATVDTVVDAIQLVTDALPNSGALTDLATAANLATVDTVVDSILADTGTDGVVISATVANQIADALLNRDMSAVSDTTARSPLNALRFLRNKYSVAGTTLTVTKEDDSTSAWTSTLTTDAAADPVTGSDPS